jgi:hypothetical protein
MVLCESFHRIAVRSWPGHFNVWMHWTLSLFTLTVTVHRAEPPQWTWWAVLFISFIVANYLYERARTMDCGIVARGSRAANVTAAARMCDHCDVYMFERMFHCRLCNICTDRFDHHCAWLNRCVARRNFLHFVAMLLCELIYLGTGALMLWKFAYPESWIEPGFGTFVELCAAEVVFVVFWLAVAALVASAASRISQNKTTYEIVKKPAYIAPNRFDLGFAANWGAFFDQYEHESKLYNVIKATAAADDETEKIVNNIV